MLSYIFRRYVIYGVGIGGWGVKELPEAYRGIVGDEDVCSELSVSRLPGIEADAWL